MRFNETGYADGWSRELRLERGLEMLMSPGAQTEVDLSLWLKQLDMLYCVGYIRSTK